MKATNIIMWFLLSVFVVGTFGFCDMADADEGDHCVNCCPLGCCEAIAASNTFVINLAASSKIIFAGISFSQSPFLKGLERPPRTSFC